jgi:hypothetical protein
LWHEGRTAEFLIDPFEDQALLHAIDAAIERDRARRREAMRFAALQAPCHELTERVAYTKVLGGQPARHTEHTSRAVSAYLVTIARRINAQLSLRHDSYGLATLALGIPPLFPLGRRARPQTQLFSSTWEQ